MKIGFASDHRGYTLKEELIKELKNEYEVVDYGTDSKDSVDYPDYAFILGNKVVNHEIDFGVAICGSGIGISIACNKVKGIRCAKVSSLEDVIATRTDNDANIIAFGEKTNLKDALLWIKTFVNTATSQEEKHVRRRNKIKEYEEQ
ncbi:MAG: RpiB/LacA/LacB family sugar-phosphate isomerase [Bacilli bacterium]|nr:RpiB/LacA/LacB family sugar-phosphate isomerase [Bacilli bacterium]